jgi:hypothetical protein
MAPMSGSSGAFGSVRCGSRRPVPAPPSPLRHRVRAPFPLRSGMRFSKTLAGGGRRAGAEDGLAGLRPWKRCRIRHARDGREAAGALEQAGGDPMVSVPLVFSPQAREAEKSRLFRSGRKASRRFGAFGRPHRARFVTAPSPRATASPQIGRRPDGCPPARALETARAPMRDVAIARRDHGPSTGKVKTRDFGRNLRGETHPKRPARRARQISRKKGKARPSGCGTRRQE